MMYLEVHTDKIKFFQDGEVGVEEYVDGVWRTCAERHYCSEFPSWIMIKNGVQLFRYGHVLMAKFKGKCYQYADTWKFVERLPIEAEKVEMPC